MKILPLLKKIKKFQIDNEQLNEENTKLFCVLPLFSYLGYDIFSPTDVTYEYCACLRDDKNERCDLAILDNNNEPFIIVEMKSFGKDLSQYSGQLKSYFVATSAKYAILTNGDDYWFYDASQKINIKDKEPIKRIKLSDFNTEDLSYLNNYIKNVILPIDREKLNNINKEITPIIITKEVVKEVLKTKTKTNTKSKPKQDKEPLKDSVDLFIETLDINDVLGKQKEHLFNEYTSYCNNNGYSYVSNQLFTRKVKEQLSLKILIKSTNGIKNEILVNDEYIIKLNKQQHEQKKEQEKIKFQEQLNQYNNQINNSVYRFYESNPLLVIKNKTTDEIYDIYINYCKDNNIEIISKIDFSKKINKYYNVKTTVKSVNGKVRRIFI